jgi:hypothetical protein
MAEPYTASLFKTPYDQTMNLISTGMMINPFTGETSQVFENQMPPPNTTKGILLQSQLAHPSPKLVQMQGFNSHCPGPRRSEQGGEVFRPASLLGGSAPFGSMPYDREIVKQSRQIVARDLYGNQNGTPVQTWEFGKNQPFGMIGLQPAYVFLPVLPPTQELDLAGRMPTADPLGTPLQKREEFTGDVECRKAHVSTAYAGIAEQDSGMVIPNALQRVPMADVFTPSVAQAYFGNGSLAMGMGTTCSPPRPDAAPAGAPQFAMGNLAGPQAMRVANVNDQHGPGGSLQFAVGGALPFAGMGQVPRTGMTMPAAHGALAAASALPPQSVLPTHLGFTLPLSAPQGPGTGVLPLSTLHATTPGLTLPNTALQGPLSSVLPLSTIHGTPGPVTLPNVSLAGPDGAILPLSTLHATTPGGTLPTGHSAWAQAALLVPTSCQAKTAQWTLPSAGVALPIDAEVLGAAQRVGPDAQTAPGGSVTQLIGDLVVAQNTLPGSFSATLPTGGAQAAVGQGLPPRDLHAASDAWTFATQAPADPRDAVLIGTQHASTRESQTLPVGPVSWEQSQEGERATHAKSKRWGNPWQTYGNGPQANLGFELPLGWYQPQALRGLAWQEYVTQVSRLVEGLGGSNTRVVSRLRPQDHAPVQTVQYARMPDAPSPRVVPHVMASPRLTRRAVQEERDAVLQM